MQTQEPTEGLREQVHDGEELQWVVRASRWARFADMGLPFALVGVVMTAGTVWGVFTATGALLGSGMIQLLATLAAGGLVLAVMVGVPVVGYLGGTVEYAATDRRLLVYQDALGRRIDSVPLAGVQDAEFTVSGVERLFDVATVTVDTRLGYETMSFPYTPAPESFAQSVTGLAAEVRKRGTPASTTPDGEYTPGDDVVTSEPTDGLTANLYSDERLLWVVTPNRTLRFLKGLTSVLPRTLLVAVLGGVAAFLAGTVVGGVWIGLLAAVAVGAGAVFVAVGATALTQLFGSTQYAATDRRLLEYDGRFGRRLSGVPLSSLQDAEYSVGVVEQRLGVGSVETDTDYGYEAPTLDNVENPAAVAAEISRLAASDVAERETADPGDRSVGEGIDSRSPSPDLQSNLAPDETVTWVVEPDRTAWVAARLASAVPAILSAGVAVGGVVLIQQYTFQSHVRGVDGVLYIALGVVAMAVYAVAEALFGRTEYALTDDRLVEYRGLFGRELSSVPLAGVQDAEFDVSLVESRFGVGDVTVDTHPDYEDVTLETVPDPTAIARDVSQAGVAFDDTGGRSDPQATPTDTDDGPGTESERQCQACGSGVDPSAAYCPSCGVEQAGQTVTDPSG